MDNDTYAKILEAHIEKLNQVIDKLLIVTIKKSLVYYVRPKGDYVIRMEDGKMFYTSIEDVFKNLSHIGNAYTPSNAIKSTDDYATRNLIEFRKILDIYSLNLITGETEKVLV